MGKNAPHPGRAQNPDPAPIAPRCGPHSRLPATEGGPETSSIASLSGAPAGRYLGGQSRVGGPFRSPHFEATLPNGMSLPQRLGSRGSRTTLFCFKNEATDLL